MTHKKSVRVIGGGFSGMSAAYFLAKAGFQVVLEEKSDRLGGIISTVQTPWGPAETAASGVMNSPLVESFFADLGLEVAKKSEFIKNKYIYRHGRVHRWPLNFFESARLLRGLSAVLFKKDQPQENESVKAWGTRVLGESASRYLLYPALQGIYAGDPEELSAHLILAKFFDRSHKQVRNKTSSAKTSRHLNYGRGTVAPVGGMEKLVEALAHKLKDLGVEIRCGVSSEWRPAEGGHFAKTVISTPAHHAAHLLNEAFPRVAGVLQSVEYLPLASVTLFYPKEQGLRGFGCLFPEGEGFQALGVLLADGLFLQDNEYVVERWIYGGALNRNFESFSEQQFVDLALADSARLFGQKRSLVGHFVKSWAKAVPHYSLALEQKVKSLVIEQNCVLFGNYLGHLGLKQIIHAAAELPLKWQED